ncbi:hypothetical protein N665_0003s0020 [Sinapis alba]|nr:hypothetical protein N665_0003s0020 [Sinapis alba]
MCLAIVMVVDAVGPSLPEPPESPYLSFFNTSLSAVLQFLPWKFIRKTFRDSSLALVLRFTAVCSQITFTAVCSLSTSTAVCRSTFGVFRLFYLPLWHCQEFMSEITTSPMNQVFLDKYCLVSPFMKFVLPSFPLVLSGYVAGSLVLKITDTYVSVLIKGSSNWCLIASAFVAEYVIVNCALVAVSISGFRLLYVLSNSQSFTSHLSSIDVEFRGLLYETKLLCVVYACIYLFYVLCSAFVIAVCFCQVGSVILYFEHFLL